MKFLKFFVLLVLFVGVWGVNKSPVDAAPLQNSCQGYWECTDEAQQEQDYAFANICNGIIACESLYESRYQDKITQVASY